MKETSVDIGNTYALRSLTGGEVQNANGDVIKTLEAGKQQHETAQESVWLVPDDCQVTKANFKRAALELGLLGGGENLPAWLSSLKKELEAGVLDGAKFRLWWRPEIGKLMVMTELTNDGLNEQVLAVAAKYVPEGVTAEVFNVNKYAHCDNVDDMLAVNPDYKDDLTSEGEWLYPLPNITNGDALFKDARNVKKAYLDAPSLSNAKNLFSCLYGSGADRVLEEVEIVGNEVTILWAAFEGRNNLTRFICNTENVTNMDYCFKSVRQLVEFPTKYPSLTEALLASFPCRLKHQITDILLSIPTVPKGQINIDCNKIYQEDADVLAAIESAENKGWTVVISWKTYSNVAEAAHTFRMGRPGAQPVYAKLVELDQHDGTKQRDLDWGHYVTDWQKNGYMEFASIEEAKEYFNITE